jgi:hypothetical protein
MMNLLGGRGFVGPCSSESEGLQQPIKVGQASDVDRRRAKAHCRANGRIKHPSGENDRHAGFGFDDNDIPAGSSFGVKLADLAAMQRVPTVVNLYFLADMGRMAPQWPWAAATGPSPDPMPVVSVPQPSTA